MPVIILSKLISILLLSVSLFCTTSFFYAQNARGDVVSNKGKAYHVSGHPLPRFVSLAKSKTNVRSGPGQQYPIKWVYNRANLPVEVVLEYGNWRKVKDYEGQEGWVYHTLLSGKRMAFIHSEAPVDAVKKPHEDVKKRIKTFKIEPNALVKIEECNALWCLVSTSGYSGWIQRKLLWGVYESEIID